MRRALALLALGSLGCGSDPSAPDAGTAEDAGVDAPVDAAFVAPIRPDEPVPPAWPILTPCPDGWREGIDPAEPALVTCDPWPEEGSSVCPDHQIQLPGFASCEDIGPSCPAGEFAEDLPDDRAVVYARPGAEAGDGTLSRPWGTIAEALAAAPDEAVIALARGTFDEVVVVDRPVTLWGACVSGTAIDASAAGPGEAAVSLRDGARGLRNLTVTGAGRGVTIDGDVDSEPVELVAVGIRDVVGSGLQVRGGQLTASALAVRRVGPRQGLARGLQLTDTTVVTLDGGVFERAGYEAIHVAGGARLQASHLLVRATTSPPGDDDAMGLLVLGGVVEMVDAVFEQCADYGIGALGTGVVIDATDVLIRETVPGPVGVGVLAGELATVRLWRARIERSTGMAVNLVPGKAIFSDLVLQDTLPLIAGDLVARGNGIDMEWGSAELIRVAVLGSHQAAIRTFGDSLVAASDLVVRGTRAVLSTNDVLVGSGLLLRGGRTDLLRARIEDSDVCGLLVSGGGRGEQETELHASDLVVTGSGAGLAEGRYGQGLCATAGARVSLRHARLEQNRTAALDVRGAGTEVTGTDVALAATAPQAATGGWGAGAIVLDGARLDVDRIWVSDNAWVGVLAQGEGSLVELVHLVADGTRADDLGAGGVGLAAMDGSALGAARFEVTGSALCGVQLGAGASLSLRDGQIRSNAIGACAPVGSAFVAGEEAGVSLLDNGRESGDGAGFSPDAREVPEVVAPQ